MNIIDCYKILELGYTSSEKLYEHYKRIGEEHRGDLDFLKKLQEAYETIRDKKIVPSVEEIKIINMNSVLAKERRIKNKPHVDGEMESIAKKVIIEEASKIIKDSRLSYFKEIVREEEFIFKLLNTYRALITIIRNESEGVEPSKILYYLNASKGDIDFNFLSKHISSLCYDADIINIVDSFCEIRVSKTDNMKMT